MLQIILFPLLQMKEEELFLKAVCLCHTVQINADQTDGADGPWHANGIASPLEYYASSPDEKALVEAASRWVLMPKLCTEKIAY